MSTNSPIERTRTMSWLPWVLLVLVIGIGVFLNRDRVADLLGSTPTAEESRVQTLSGNGVLRRVQRLGNLETAAFHIETVVTSTLEGTWWKAWQDGQNGLFIADGVVTAGIDLSQLQHEDVDVATDGKSVRIVLPPAQLLQTNVVKTQTYDYQTGLFGLVNLDPVLLQDAEKEAAVKLQRIACESDILSVATESARQRITDLFALMDVDVEVVAAPVPSCQVAPNP